MVYLLTIINISSNKQSQTIFVTEQESFRQLLQDWNQPTFTSVNIRPDGCLADEEPIF